MELDNIKKQFETAKVDVERPFPQEEELKAKTDRLNELNALLNVDKRENEIVGGEPDEGEELPEKKPRDLERYPNPLTIVIIYDNFIMDRKGGFCMTEKELLAARQSIVQKLTQARLEKGLSQEKLAKRIGTQRSNICRIEKGTQNLSLDLMIKIAEALDKDVSVMLEERSSTMEKVYSLRLYDETLLTFTLEERGLEGLQATILHSETAKQKLFPLDLELTNEGVVKWLERRVIPKNRQFVDEILKTLGLSVNNTKGIIDVCMGLSLNDSYWVVPADFDGKYADYNLYENRFSEALSLVAYTGVGGSREAFSTSPELTTNGMLRKAWRFVEDDGIYLYKGGTEGAANTGNEPYSEYYACQIADKMGISCVQYDLENWKGILASKCRLFTDINTSFVPVGRILRKTTLKACLDYYKTLGDEFYEQLCSMLVFDALIYNEDRHFGNFGLLRNNHTGEIIAPAPIFDNGLSLFNYAMPDDFKNLSAYAKTRSNPYRISYEDVCKEVMGAKQKAQLRRMVDFKFTRHPSLNLPEQRLTAIEKQLGERTRELLSIPVQRSTKRKNEPER